jgi:homoserine O-acetyltransferase/O-succinyltransferase
MNDVALDEDAVVYALPGEVGLVEPRDFVFEREFWCDDGRILSGFQLRYETYGRLNEDKTNAILVCHALSGDHHCAGIHALSDKKSGWWNNLIGPGKAVDTNHFFVVCANVLGGCQGSTGPLTIDPSVGVAYGLRFPAVTIRDMVRSQKLLLEYLGVKRLHCVLGGSMGGMQALQWSIEYPDFCLKILAMATTAHEGAQAIAFNEVGRQAIMQDPEWNQGNYPQGGGPRVGLAIARMMAHITYLSDASMDRKFGRREVRSAQAGSESCSGRDSDNPATAPAAFDVQFEVQSYLRYQGKSFINRFDANTYLYITRAIDSFDLVALGGGSLECAFAPVQAKVLVVGFTSDWLFPPEQNRAVTLALQRAGKNASYVELATDLGHDSFLLESLELYDLIRGFLRGGTVILPGSVT